MPRSADKISVTSCLKKCSKNFVKHILAFLGSKKYKLWRDNIKRFKQEQQQEQRRKLTGNFEQINQRRTKAFDKFDDEYICNRIPSTYEQALNTKFDEYKYAVTGSDMVWRNWSGTKEDLEYFYLAFMPENKRVNYAPSFGFKKFDKKFYELNKKYLSAFKKLSCRESEGCDLIKQTTGREAIQVIDPTFLITAEQWRKISKKPSYNIPEKYALLYSFGRLDKEQSQAMKKICGDMKIIDIFNWEDIEHYLTTPDEFLWLIDHAEIIFTSSFHGTAFSINFKKNFISFGEYSYKIKDILSRLGISDRIYRSGSKIPEGGIDYGAVDEKLNAWREISMSYLRDCLELN